MNSNSNNRAELNPRIINQTVSRPRTQNPRFVYVNQNPLQPIQSNISTTNASAVIQPSQPQNQSSITTKLCKFFKNLLELEREQGRYKESVAVIQKYINKEINIDELGAQLKGSTSKATLPDSLMTSLNSNIDDLRREMFYGRVRIDGINPPPESILDLTNHGTALPSTMNNNARLPSNQQMAQRPVTFPVATLSNNINNTGVPRSIQPQSGSQIIRPTIQAIQPNARQLRPATNSNTTATVFTSQSVLNISQAGGNLRTIAPSSPIRPSFVQNQSMSTANQIRTVAVSTTALTSIKSAQPIINNNNNNSNNHVNATTLVNNDGGGGGGGDELKIEGVTSLTPEIVTVAVKQPLSDSNSSLINTSTNMGSVSLPTNILNHNNYRQKINEFIKSESNGSETAPLLNISDEALNYVSEAMENFSINLLEQAAVFACHRQELFKDNPSYRKIDDVRSQMKFLQDLEEYQRASEEEKQKAELFKQAKSRSKMDNQEQQKIKETVRKIQEYDKNCDEYSRANMTALKAIGSKRKQVDTTDDNGAGCGGPTAIKTARFVSPGTNLNATNFVNHVPSSQIYINQNFMTAKPPRNPSVSRFRNKRIILKDFQLVLDQDVKLKRFKTYKKIFTYGRY